MGFLFYGHELLQVEGADSQVQSYNCMCNLATNGENSDNSDNSDNGDNAHNSDNGDNSDNADNYNNGDNSDNSDNGENGEISSDKILGPTHCGKARYGISILWT